MENLLILLVLEGKEDIDEGRLNVSDTYLSSAAIVSSNFHPTAKRCRSNRRRPWSILSSTPLPWRMSIKDVICLSGSV